MFTPKLSIIVPVYNVEQYLDQCLSSLVNQTLKDIEIICVNDGSTDESNKILQKFASQDNRIKVFNQANQGQSVARNLAIQNAKGEYLGFVDSDDWVDLDYFEKLYNSAKQYDCDIACAGFKRCGKREKIKKSFSEIKVYSNIEDKLEIDNIPSHNYIWNKIYKREKWNFTFTPGRYYEDMALLIKIVYQSDKLVTVPDTYYYYRHNPFSTIAAKSSKHTADFRWAYDEVYKFAEEKNIKITKNSNYRKKEFIKLFGITIFKVYHSHKFITYKLFGFIPCIRQYEV